MEGNTRYKVSERAGMFFVIDTRDVCRPQVDGTGSPVTTRNAARFQWKRAATAAIHARRLNALSDPDASA